MVTATVTQKIKLKVKTQAKQINSNKGVRKEDSQSATLFNIENVMRNMIEGNLGTRGRQIIAYADDIVLVTKNMKII